MREYYDGGIDAGLLMLVATTSPARPWTQREIAEVCGCSRSLIWLIEKRAIRKLAKNQMLAELLTSNTRTPHVASADRGAVRT